MSSRKCRQGGSGASSQQAAHSRSISRRTQTVCGGAERSPSAPTWSLLSARQRRTLLPDPTDVRAYAPRCCWGHQGEVRGLHRGPQSWRLRSPSSGAEFPEVSPLGSRFLRPAAARVPVRLSLFQPVAPPSDGQKQTTSDVGISLFPGPQSVWQSHKQKELAGVPFHP